MGEKIWLYSWILNLGYNHKKCSVKEKITDSALQARFLKSDWLSS
jgi:hypothetical protein